MKKYITFKRLFFLILIASQCHLIKAQTVAQSVPIEHYLTRMDHVGINITNLEKSANWYKKVLGFGILHKWKTTWMIGNEKIRIGLFLRPNAVKIDSLDNTIAITHFAFITDKKGFEKTQQKLKAMNIPFTPPEDTGIAYSIFFNDPDGHQIEITTYHVSLPDSTAKQ